MMIGRSSAKFSSIDAPSRFCLSYGAFYSSITHCFPYNPSNSSASSQNPIPNNTVLFNYLIESLGFPKPRALSVSDRYSHINAIDRPQSVVNMLKSFGFSDTHIRSSVLFKPQILFSDTDKTLKPKLQFLQRHGLSGSNLGEFVRKNVRVLTCSLNATIKPLFDTLKKLLLNDKDNEDLIRVLLRCTWFRFDGKLAQSRLTSNVAYLQSCGIVRSKLPKVIVRNPRIFVTSESNFRELVSRVLDMGFVIHSAAFPYALFIMHSVSRQMLSKKFELIRSFGFSDTQCLQIFRTNPSLFGRSEKSLKLGYEFYLNIVKLESSILVSSPSILSYSLKLRAIPRYRVFRIIKMRKLMKEGPSFYSLLVLNEKKFVDKYISRFVEHADELLKAYKCGILSPE